MWSEINSYYLEYKMLLYAASKSDELFFIHFTSKKKSTMGYDTRVMHPPSAVCVPTLSICLTTYFKFLTEHFYLAVFKSTSTYNL